MPLVFIFHQYNILLIFNLNLDVHLQKGSSLTETTVKTVNLPKAVLNPTG